MEYFYCYCLKRLWIVCANRAHMLAFVGGESVFDCGKSIHNIIITRNDVCSYNT